MKPRSWAGRAAIALAIFAGAVPACAEGGAAREARTPVDAPVVHLPDEASASRAAPEPDAGGEAIRSESGRTALAEVDAAPDVRSAAIDAASPRGKLMTGRLAPEKIQLVVRANFGTFRHCYENALRAGPNLQGRVAVRFVIDTEGRVPTAADDGSDVPDAAVVKCVVDEFRKLRFPKPEGGSLTVIYPVMFAPGE